MKLFNKGHKKNNNTAEDSLKTEEISVDEVVEMKPNEAEGVVTVESEVEESEVEESEVEESEVEESEVEESEVEESEVEESEVKESEVKESEVKESEIARADEEKSLEELDQEVEDEVRRTELLPVDEINGALEGDDTSLDNATKKVSKSKNAAKVALRIIGGIIGALLLVYIAGTVYFHYNFFYNTSMNGADVSFKSVQAVHTNLEDKVDNYILTMITSDGADVIVKGSDINIGYIESKDVATALDLQMAYKWPMMFFKERQFKMDVEITFNEDVLVDTVIKMDFANPTEKIKPTNAYPAYEDGVVVIIDEIYGNEIVENIGEILMDAVYNMEEEVHLMDAKAYLAPEFTKDSETVVAAAETMNTFIKAEINYTEGDVIDSETIASWIKVDTETIEVSLDTQKVSAYVKDLESKYNTYNSTISFTNPVGKKATVTGGNYGVRVNASAEAEQILTDINSGASVSREIKYSQKVSASSSSNPFGDTYVCLDITLQKVYMLYKGSVVLTSDVVTGSVSGGMATPQGVYTLSYKTKNAVLRGDIQADGSYGYASPVSYWMPFNGGIGFHDASWRSTYGGTIYKTNGSHGCVNMPLANAAKLYEYIDSSMPIVCHY